MKSIDLLECIGDVQDEYILNAKQAGKQKKTIWLTSGVAAAACLCLVTGILFASGVLKLPGVRHNEMLDPKISYYEIHDLLARDDFSHILWGSGRDDNSASENDPNQSGTGDIPPNVSLETVVPWNGIQIAASLEHQIKHSNAGDLLAITVRNVSASEILLEDFIYEGTTYPQLVHGCKLAKQKRDDLVSLKRFSSIFDRWEGKDEAEFWNKVYSAVDEAFIAQYCSEGKFDTTAISNDLNTAETELLILENKLSDCVRAYNAKHNPIPDLRTLMTEKKYYVAGNGGTFAVIVPVGSMEQLAADMVSLYDGKLLEQVAFTLATRSDLGIEDNPTTDDPIIPGGAVEDIPVDDVQQEKMP